MRGWASRWWLGSWAGGSFVFVSQRIISSLPYPPSPPLPPPPSTPPPHHPHPQPQPLDTTTKHCTAEDGLRFFVEYDRLAIATGSQGSTFGIPGVEKYTHFLRCVPH